LKELMYDYSNPIIYHPSKPIAMKTNAVSKELEVIKRPKSQPFVSLLLPFDPKMTSKFSIESRLKIILDEVRHELFAHYDFDAAIEVSQKLKTTVRTKEALLYWFLLKSKRFITWISLLWKKSLLTILFAFVN
jgi:hypothetical protein